MHASSPLLTHLELIYTTFSPSTPLPSPLFHPALPQPHCYLTIGGQALP